MSASRNSSVAAGFLRPMSNDIRNRTLPANSSLLISGTSLDFSHRSRELRNLRGTRSSPTKRSVPGVFTQFGN